MLSLFSLLWWALRWLGYLIAWDEERLDGREGAAPELADIWREFVLPWVVVR